MSAIFTAVENSGPFVGTPQLLRIVPHLLLPTFWASLPDCSRCPSILFCQCLNSGSFRAKDGGECSGLRFCSDSRWGGIYEVGISVAWLFVSTGFSQPLFLAPQTSQTNTTVLSPEAPSSKFPQSVQKTSEPIAVMAAADRQINALYAENTNQ